MVVRRARRGRPAVARVRHDLREELTTLQGPVGALAQEMRAGMEPLRTWTTEDLVQEVFLRALVKLDQFKGDSQLKTWVLSLAKRHLISMARKAALRPRAGGDLGAAPTMGSRGMDPEHTLIARGMVRDLLDWLRTDGPPDGDRVIRLALRNQGDLGRVAAELTTTTGEPWTETRVRRLVKQIGQQYGGAIR